MLREIIESAKFKQQLKKEILKFSPLPELTESIKVVLAKHPTEGYDVVNGIWVYHVNANSNQKIVVDYHYRFTEDTIEYLWVEVIIGQNEID